MRGSQGTWLKFLWENIKKQRCSHLCVAQIQMLEENSLLYAHPTDNLDFKTKGTNNYLRCPLLPGCIKFYREKRASFRVIQTWFQILALPLASSVALVKLLDPYTILTTVYNLEIITVPTSESCFEDKMK